MAVRIRWCEFKSNCRLLKGSYQSSRIISSANVAFCANGKHEKKHKKYTNTVALPRTDFPLRLDSQKRIDRDNYLHEVLEMYCRNITE
jgi:hypothetical protein